MSRAQRLFDLIQLLRQHRFPITGAKLAEKLGISLRTVYRDIATLQAQGATIEGEPGLGYVLRPGFMLPPLMFSDEEYVDNLSQSCEFYKRLFKIEPVESSPTFCMFKLSTGMGIGLKDKHAQHLKAYSNGGCELAFTVANQTEVERIFEDWQEHAINILETPHTVPFGYTFTALDPDNNRLRVVALSK